VQNYSDHRKENYPAKISRKDYLYNTPGRKQNAILLLKEVQGVYIRR
jgi:hypothetical protein